MKLLSAGAMANICLFIVRPFLARVTAFVKYIKRRRCFFSLVSFLRIIAAYKPQIELKNLLLVMTFKNLFKASNIGEIVP